MNDNHFKFTPQVLLMPFFSVFAIWAVFWAEIRFGFDLGHYGILPRTFEGLRGIVFSPFLHGNIDHLYSNTIPLLILLAALSYFYRELALKVLVFGILLSGFLTWIIGRENYHIGASGLIYVLVSFIFFKGIMTKYYRLVALSLTVILLYGSTAWYIFPHIDDSISWEGHLAGLITGFVFAVYLKTPEYKKLIRYEWEKEDYNPQHDKFMERFDENGNFVNLPPPEPEVLQENDLPFYTYTFIPREKQEE